jgi:cyanophycin synthetase
MVDCAVLETARGGILREGLGYKMADVGVVLNVQSDHLGLKGIHTIEDLAKVKSVVAEMVRKGGVTVLNADDEQCVKMAPYCREKIIYFSMRPSNPAIRSHLADENTAVIHDRGYIAIASGQETVPVAQAKDMPITMEGRALFNLQNALAATAVARALGLALKEIRHGLVSFFPSASQTPGRANFFAIDDFEVMLDYAHNLSAYQNIIDLVKRVGNPRRVFVFDVVGDRRDEDIAEICRIVAENADHAVVFEDEDTRGRAPGELTELACKALTAAGFDADRIDKIPDVMAAVDHALSIAQKDDLVCVMSGRVEKVIRHLYDIKEGQFRDR